MGTSLRSPREMLAKAAVDKAARDRRARLRALDKEWRARLQATAAEFKLRHANLIQSIANVKLAEDRAAEAKLREERIQAWFDQARESPCRKELNYPKRAKSV